jgi:dihydrofolate synthase/folylpolyglutamate synthase
MKPSYQRLVLIIGILGDKDRAGILSQLLPLADLVIVTKPNYSRAMDVEALATEVRQQHGTVETTGTVAAAIALARHRAAPEDLVLITGSLYVVGDARAEFSGPDLDAPALAGLKG